MKASFAATYKALAFSSDDIKILAKDAGIKLSKVERNGALGAMKSLYIYSRNLIELSPDEI